NWSKREIGSPLHRHHRHRIDNGGPYHARLRTTRDDLARRLQDHAPLRPGENTRWLASRCCVGNKQCPACPLLRARPRPPLGWLVPHCQAKRTPRPPPLVASPIERSKSLEVVRQHMASLESPPLTGRFTGVCPPW